LFVDLNDQLLEASLVGEMIPQPVVIDGQGHDRLLDAVLGNGFALLAQDDAGESTLEKFRVVLEQNFAPRCVRVFNESSALQKSSDTEQLRFAQWSDQDVADLRYERPLRTHRDQILLIRPDRYVLAAFSCKDDPSALASRVNNLVQ